MGMKIAFVDLDGTLVALNTTYSFVIYVLKKKKRFLDLIKLYILTHILIKFFIFARFINLRAYYLSMLKGLHRDEIREMAKSFIEEIAYSSLHEEILDLINKLKNNGYKIILLTATIEEIAEAFVKKIGLIDDFYSSKLKFEKNMCLGVLEYDLLFNKKVLVSELVESNKCDTNSCFFISDNPEDLEAMKYVGNPVVVLDDKMKIQYWRNAISKNNIIMVKPKVRDIENIIYLPLGFVFARFKKKIGVIIRYILERFGIPFLITVLSSTNEVGTLHLIVLLLSWLVFTVIYEIGYLINDCIAIKYEKNPTYRVPESICLKVNTFIFIKVVTVFVGVFLLFMFNYILNLKLFLLNFIVFIILSLLIYLIHNFSNISIRILTRPILRMLVLVVPVSVFGNQTVKIAILFYFIFYFAIDFIFYILYKKDMWKDDYLFYYFLIKIFILLIILNLEFLTYPLFFIGLYDLFIETIFMNRLLAKKIKTLIDLLKCGIRF